MTNAKARASDEHVSIGQAPRNYCDKAQQQRNKFKFLEPARRLDNLLYSRLKLDQSFPDFLQVAQVNLAELVESVSLILLDVGQR